MITSSVTSGTGRYKVDGLLPADYFVSTDSLGRYRDEAYDDRPCPVGFGGLCDLSAATPVAVALEATTTGVDFELAGFQCGASSTVLWLGDGRFRVEAFWHTRAGHTGEGNAVRLTGDSGYYWFFSPDNVEVVVKVLDGCDVEPFNSYWVFAAGLTDVEVLLRVTDLATGAVREYENPLGRPFRPILDTGAFATCSD